MPQVMSDRNEAIIKKIKGLLALATDHKNDNESQSAFVLAQKLMMKHEISIAEVEANGEKSEVTEGQATAFKKISWWETELARIIAKNFRVKYYFNNNHNMGRQVKRAIVFLGFEKDIKLAKEIYILAHDVMSFHTKKYVTMYYEARPSKPRNITKELKDSYMRGFLAGLKDKFAEQVSQMEQEWGLMVLVPAEVEEKYDSMFGKRKGGVTFRMPSIGESKAYANGYHHGNRVDYTKRTLGGE